MNKIYNAAIYLRLSREDGDNTESESINNQREFLMNYINKKIDLNYIDEYIDDGYTGSSFDRPGWKRIMKDIESKKINTIITKDLSRMGRDYISMGNYIEKVFPEKNIRYIAINDDIDTLYETPGLDYLQFKLMFNDYYLKDTSKKIKKILKTKKEQGQYTGWKGIYGYKRDLNNKHKLIVDEEVRHIIIRMFKLAKEGKSPKQIADIFSLEKISTPSIYANLNRGKKKTAYHLWSSRTIEELLTNPTYIGHLVQGIRRKVSYKSKKEVRIPKDEWIVIKNTHEPIISEELFNTVGELLKKNKNNPKGENNYLLKGFLYCKECGHRIGVIKSSDKKRKYCICNYYVANSKHNLCTPHSMNYDKLEEIVLNNVREQCIKSVNNLNYKELIDIIKNKTDQKEKIEMQINNINNRINQINNNIDKIYEDKLNNIITLEQYQRLIIKFKNNINSLNLKKKELHKQIKRITISGINDEYYLDRIKEYLLFNNISRELLVNLIDKIVISQNKEVEISYKFRLN